MARSGLHNFGRVFNCVKRCTFFPSCIQLNPCYKQEIVMSLSLSSDVKHLIGWKWEQIAPFFDDLVGRTLTGENVSEWLGDWSRLARRLSETGARLEIATTRNTTDQEAEHQF